MFATISSAIESMSFEIIGDYNTHGHAGGWTDTAML